MKLLHSIHLKFKDSKFTEGKYMWLQQFFGEDTDTWDAYGAEEDYSFAKLPIRNVYTSVCNKSDACPNPVIMFTSNMVGYDVAEKNMACGIIKWMKKQSLSICQRSSANHSAIPCDGLRSTTP